MIGKALTALMVGVASAQVAVAAAEVHFSAQADRQQISLDDSVSLKISIQLDGSGSVGQPTFQAPDFEVVNEYNSSFVESYYNNGRFGVKNNHQITKVLKPLKTGSLTVSGIQVQVDGKTYSAPDITVQVGNSGAGTPPPRNYGGGGVGLRGAGKHNVIQNVMVRAEVDKDKVVKGEQVIVSYYLYQRSKVFNIAATKFPQLKDVLKEEVEMPMMGTHLDPERVVLDGVPYQRSLLARYAIFPLKEGKIKLDPLGIKYNYYATNNFNDDGEDPFLNFFQQMTPRAGNTQSDPVTIEVAPLPSDNRPASFAGAVGDFNITAAVDKYDVRANEALTMTVKIEGRGNTAAIGEPKAKWPDGLELYDSKGVAKSGKGAVGEKVFEFLLIPRVPGKLKLPSLEFSYYDTNKKAYVTKTTDPVDITVLEPAPGSAAPPARNNVAQGALNPGAPADGKGAIAPAPDTALRGLKPMAEEGRDWLGSLPIWRILYPLAALGFIGFVGFVLMDVLRKAMSQRAENRTRRAHAESRSWKKLRKRAKDAVQGAAWTEVCGTYEIMAGLVLEALDRKYGLGAKSLARAELRRILTEEHGVVATEWAKAEKLLEMAELVRFASSVGAVSEDRARLDLARHIDEAESIVQGMDSWPSGV